MAIVYTPAELEHDVLMARRKWHPVLEALEVGANTVFVTDENPETGECFPALKDRGYDAAAKIKIHSSLERAIPGVADVRLVVDQVTWEGLGEFERMALLDHELAHVQVKADGGGLVTWAPCETCKGTGSGLPDHAYPEVASDMCPACEGRRGELIGSPLRDEHGRPKLKMRLHDWELGGFREVAQRHREASIEVQAAQHHLDAGTGQYAWEWAAAARGRAKAVQLHETTEIIDRTADLTGDDDFRREGYETVEALREHDRQAAARKAARELADTVRRSGAQATLTLPHTGESVEIR